MKFIIAGGREYKFTESDIEELNILKDHPKHPITEVVCGMARGADTEGRLWAESHNIPVKEFPADWKRYGKIAGIKRNQQMADYADGLIAFNGNNGTADMIKRATRQKLIVIVMESEVDFEEIFDIV